MQTFDLELFQGSSQTLHGLGNSGLNREGLLERIQKVQLANDLPQSSALITDYGDENQMSCPHFSIEMETGTGKTYVYLRTLFDLHKNHGYAKFIIVVPSVAIREGTLKTLEMTRDHFRSLYDQVPYDYFVYDSKNPGKIRQFASSNQLQIMVINIDAFRGAKDSRIFAQNRDQLSGHKPADFVASTHPIVIIDEPQSVDNTPASQKAILSLNPLCTLRYSATHRNPYHLLHQLNPVQAFDQNLVKGIEVDSITMDGAASQADPYIKLEKVELNKGGSSIRAKLKIIKAGGTSSAAATVKNNDDLQEKAKGSEAYSASWIVREINATSGSEYIEFANGRVLAPGEEIGGATDEIAHEQIRATVRAHCEKLNQLKPRGIKVLSLFFIDRVASYKTRTESGQAVKEKFARWFEEAYEEYQKHPVLVKNLKHSADKVHDGYFAGDKKGRKDTSGTTKADTAVYDLIMKKKEQLLSDKEPIQFIFSHSALKEGWDNPNVFQIYTLREMGTDTERRQTLGRGLRLARNEHGVVVKDSSINRLTVICNERFEDYVNGLQNDIAAASGIQFGIVKEDDFRHLVFPNKKKPLGRKSSKLLWKQLVKQEYLTDEGKVTDKFAPEKEDFILDTSDTYRDLRPDIIQFLRDISFTSRIRRKRDRKQVKLNKAVQLTPEFEELWRRISQKTQYSVQFSTKELIKTAAKNIKEMPTVPPVTIASIKESLDVTQGGIKGSVLRESISQTLTCSKLPNLVAHLQEKTRLTRSTLSQILLDSGRLPDFRINPTTFTTLSTQEVRNAMNAIVEDGVTYHRLNQTAYEQRLFEDDDAREIHAYVTRLYKVQNKGKSLFNFVEWESEPEKEFAKELDSRDEVKLFFKLPRWFKIPTPVGNYNPDWAIVTGEENKLYLIRETKSTLDKEKRRANENRKIKFGRRHFEAISSLTGDEVDFHDCVTLKDALNSIT